MKNKHYRLIVAAALLLFAVTGSKAQQAQSVSAPRTLSYQGILTSTGTPGNILGANRLLTVTLYGDANGTIKLWQSTMNTPIDSNGVFNCTLGTADNPLPQPSAMDRAIWLGVAVDNGTELRPLSQVTASAYAINVADSAITSQKIATGAVGTQNLADGSITTSKLADSSITPEKMNMDYVSSISVNGQLITGAGTNLNIVSGDGVNATWIPDQSTLEISSEGTGGATTLAHNGTSDYWGQTGNNSTNPDTNYIGTSDSEALEIHVNNNSVDPTLGNKRVMRYEATKGGPNILGGWRANSIGPAVTGSIIAGGGDIGDSNTMLASNSTISGGDDNTVTGTYSTVSGGHGNSAISFESTVGGGTNNVAGNTHPSSDTEHQTVGGGNSNTASGDDAAIAGGENNSTYGDHTAIAGGYANSIAYGATGAAIGGGEHNTANGDHASVTGGYDNSAKGSHSSVLGGLQNQANGVCSSVLGGQLLDLGDSSFGFNGSSSTINPVNLTSFSNVGYVGNIDLWIGNVDDSARALRFYGPNDDYLYGSGSHYSSFTAGSQTGNINYTLPDTIPIAGQFLKAANVSGTNVTLSWDTVTGGGGGLAGWLLSGNSGTSPGTNYLGTNDDSAFEIHLDNSNPDTTGGDKRVMRYSEGTISPELLGGSSYNSIVSGLSGNVISGGGDSTMPNMVKQATSTFGYPLPANMNFVGGGEGNVTWSEHDVIAGGRGNMMMADTFRSGFNFIGGGDSNFVGWGSYGNVIAGGKNNTTANAYGSVGGGIGNLLNGPGDLNTIAGGYYNTVGGDISISALNIQASTIAGGDSNMIRQGASYSAIVGGWHNTIDSGVIYSMLGGGFQNRIQTIGNNDTGDVCFVTIGNVFTPGYAVLTGGENNTVRSTLASLTGGYKNMIDTNGGTSVLAGGDSNYVGAGVSALGGGFHNTIASAAYGSTIPGGVGLKAEASGQFVAGTYNIPDSTPGPSGALAIFGNGMEDTDRSNAVKIYKPGFLTAYGTPTSAGSWEGSLYKTNTIEAWGYVVAAGTDTLEDHIGVSSVTRIDTGVYQVVLNVWRADGSLIPATDWTANAKNLSVVATLGQTAAGVVPGMIVATPIVGPSIFKIYTFNQLGQRSNAYDFQFHVILDMQ